MLRNFFNWLTGNDERGDFTGVYLLTILLAGSLLLATMCHAYYYTFIDPPPFKTQFELDQEYHHGTATPAPTRTLHWDE